MKQFSTFFSWILLLLSACLYPIPFLFPEHMWWLSFIFMIPLFSAALLYRLTGFQGYVWAAVSLAGHLSGVLHGIFSMAEGGDIVLRGFLVVGIVALQSCYGVLFFLVSQKIVDWYKGDYQLRFKAVVWLLTSWCYFLILEYCWMLQYDVCEGYMLLNPLVPLMIYPSLLRLLPVVGKPLCMMLLLLPQLVCAVFFVTRCCMWSIITIGALVPWLISVTGDCSIRESVSPSWTEQIVGIRTFFSHTFNLSEFSEHLASHCREALKGAPNSSCIFFPESSVYSEQFETTPEIVARLHESVIGKPVHVIVGSFRIKDGYHRNSLYWIYNGNIVDVFDKRHAMALTERVPRLVRFKCVEDLYFKYMGQVKTSENRRPLWQLSDIVVIPYLCSELFFNQKPDDTYGNAVILACCNDSWTRFIRQKKLMYLGARFKALEWQRPIIYVTFSYTALLMPDGGVHALTTEYDNV